MLLHRTGAIFEIICIFEKQTLKYEADILVHFYVGNACRQRAFPVWTTERIGSWTITDGALRDIRHRLREKVCDLGGPEADSLCVRHTDNDGLLRHVEEDLRF